MTKIIFYPKSAAGVLARAEELLYGDDFEMKKEVAIDDDARTELLRDPVILDTGYTYDRNYIQRHLSTGSKLCPASKIVIKNPEMLIPNRILKQWLINVEEDGKYSQHGSNVIPEDFRCYLSKELMNDPVVLETGYTYDRTWIESYLRSGRKICPASKHMMKDPTVIIPNRMLKSLISNWCSTHGIAPPASKKAVKLEIESLIGKLSIGEFDSDNQFAMKKLSAISRDEANNPVIISLREKLGKALCNITCDEFLSHEYLIDLLTLLLNFSDIPKLRKVVCQSLLPFLLSCLIAERPMAARIACEIIQNLSDVNCNRRPLLKFPTCEVLLRLLKSDNLELVNTTATTLIKLCGNNAFLQRATSEGIHRIVLSKLKNELHEEAMMKVLTMFLPNRAILSEVMEMNAAPVLIKLIKSFGGLEDSAVELLYGMSELNEGLIETMHDDLDLFEAVIAVSKTANGLVLPKAIGILAKLKPKRCIEG